MKLDTLIFSNDIGETVHCIDAAAAGVRLPNGPLYANACELHMFSNAKTVHASIQ